MSVSAPETSTGARSRPSTQTRVITRPGAVTCTLELAAGTGETGFLAASRLGEQGRLISRDFSPQMVQGPST
jgi:ubiquinone/menaquinone biosynthesis C-methylase UbiE